MQQPQPHAQQPLASQQQSPNVKRQRSPSPTMYQSPQHHNMMSSVVSSLSPVTSGQFQSGGMASPNKRMKMISTSMSTYPPVMLPQAPTQLPMSFSIAPPQSAFSSYSNTFPTSPSFKQQQPGQQKSPLVPFLPSVGLLNASQATSLPYGLIPRMSSSSKFPTWTHEIDFY
jgi:hypothetical protein